MAYNGWTNYQTWAVHLWLTNDQTTYCYCRTLATEATIHATSCRQVVEGIWPSAKAPTYLLADRLKEYVQHSNPLLDTGPLGLKIERDLHWTPKPLSECQ